MTSRKLDVGGPVGALDDLMNAHVTPAMQVAGFEKVGRVFRAVGESGDHAFIWYSEKKSQRPGGVTFLITASIMITTYWDFVTRDEPVAGPVSPGSLSNTLVIDLEAPGEHALHPGAEHHHEREYWVFTAGTRNACGEVLATVLVDDLAPWLLHRLARAALVEEIERPTRSWRGGPYGKATQAVLALLDDGPISEIDRLLPRFEDVSPDKSLTGWITARLETRRQAQGG